MSGTRVHLGFLPLVDAAPLIIASELGFDQDMGVDIALQKMPNWSALRETLALGEVDAAHMLAPVPIAAALGLGAVSFEFEVLSVLNLNGNVIGVSQELAAKMPAERSFTDALAVGQDLMTASEGRLRIGVPFAFSMHRELTEYWLARVPGFGMDKISFQTIPPILVPEAMAAGEIDAFCVGEPWASRSVERAGTELILPTSAIWQAAPEKVLAVRKGWAEDHAPIASAILQAVIMASRYIALAENMDTVSEILSRRHYLNISSRVIDRILTGNLMVNAALDVKRAPGFLEFYDRAATFPWRSSAKWIGYQLAKRNGLEPNVSMQKAGAVFRSDLYREFLKDTAIDMPSASEKVEGSLTEKTGVGSARGTILLGPDRFFDGSVFDPDIEYK